LAPLSLNSAAFDPYLYLIGPDGAVLAEDDDGGDAPERPHPGGQRFLPARARAASTRLKSLRSSR
jgi:hypothetical protein